MKHSFLRQWLAAVLVVLCVCIAFPAPAHAYDTVVDPSTMNDWLSFFPSDDVNTRYAGAMWMDKSVFNSKAFDKISAPPQDQFQVALSAVAATKEIVGYSTLPTDTVFVLDMSISMRDNGGAQQLVPAANSAIQELLNLNPNNRVGVVLFSGESGQANGHTTVLLPLGRYDTSTVTNGVKQYLQYLQYSSSGNGRISVHHNVVDANNQSLTNYAEKNVDGSTYIQAGLLEALDLFESVPDTTVPSGTIQEDTKYLPILVLMSDGEPTLANSNFTQGGTPNAGTGIPSSYGNVSETGRVGMSFLSQLTASYVIKCIEDHYNRPGEGLFYTLGLNVASDPCAYSVLDPASTNYTDAYWNTYLSMTSGNLSVSVPSSSGSAWGGSSTKTVAVQPHSDARQQYYVDSAFFASNANGLIDEFDNIVQQIIIQSRYFATDLEGGNPDFSGYLAFEDQIGEFMEVKAIKGMVHGNELHSGATFASFLRGDALGSIENPEELGLEFRDSLCTRLNISKDEGIALIQAAFDAGQLYYNSDSDFGNSVGWYADANGAYMGFWNEGVTTPPSGARYKVRSYGYFGATDGSIANSDMMYMTVRVTTDMQTGEQRVNWNVPAALMPLITYKVALDGSTINSPVLNVTYESEVPIQLVYEVGLKDDITPLTVAEKVGNTHPFKKADGTYQFWSNHWNNWTSDDHLDHETTTAEFSPSLQNELYYYTTNSPLYVKNGNGYTEVKSQPTSSTTYYHKRYHYAKVNGNWTTVERYQEVASEVAVGMSAVGNDGVYYIPQNTAYRQKTDYELGKLDNVTESIHFAHKPLVTSTGRESEMLTKLGNNGRLTMVPATGLKISKTINVPPTPGTDTSFTFRITLADANGQPLSGAYSAVMAALDAPSGVDGTVTFNNGVAHVNLNANQTLYLPNMPVGTRYTVNEVSNNHDYKLLTVHVNGQTMHGFTAQGTVQQYVLDDADFVNTTVQPAGLLITKQVQHPFGAQFTVPQHIRFTAQVTLQYNNQPLANESLVVWNANGVQTAAVTDANGRLTLSIGDGETLRIGDIPEGTTYTVEETALPSGFTLDAGQSSNLTGVADTTATREAKLVNVYQPVAPSGDNVLLKVVKTLTGREWNDTDQFTFSAELIRPGAQAGGQMVTNFVVLDKTHQSREGKVSGSMFNAPGEWLVHVTEAVPENPIPGVTYDNKQIRFGITVEDPEMDGQLQITKVENKQNAVVTTDGNGNYRVTMAFENQYAPTGSAQFSMTVHKTRTADSYKFPLNGFEFGIYSTSTPAAGEEPLVRSTFSNSQGHATFEQLVFPASMIREEPYVYYLCEIAPAVRLANMKYSTQCYKLKVLVSDNRNGGVAVSWMVTDMNDEQLANNAVQFANHYDPADAFVLFSGSKELTGRILNDGEFEFELYAANAHYEKQGAPRQTATNDETGTFAFEPITFEDDGTYYYVIKENNDADTTTDGLTYDSREYHAEVKIEHDSATSGMKSTVEMKLADTPVSDIVFENSYAPTPVDVTIQARKSLSGRELEDDEFTFELIGNGTTLETKNDADGKVIFSPISYDHTKVGEHRYKVREQKGTAGGVVYDGTVFDVIVNVWDDSHGALHATTRYELNGQARTEMVFSNSYSPNALSLDFDAQKKLLAGDDHAHRLGENDFIVELIDARNNNVIASAGNTENGLFRFEDAVTITRPGTYTYRLQEVNTNRPFVSYDQTSYEVEVEVVDDKNGKLVEASRKITRDGEDYNASGNIVFVNRFDPVVLEDILVTKVIDHPDGLVLPVSGYQFKLVDQNGKAVTAVTDEKGYTVFHLQYDLYDKDRTYIYTLSEINTGVPNIQYSEQVNTIAITVLQHPVTHGLYLKIVQDYKPVNLVDITFTNVYAEPVPPVSDMPPQTGDNSGVEYAVMLLVLSALGMLTLRRRQNG